MGIAALIIGIISVIVGFIPGCGLIALVPAIVGLILGIIEISKKSKKNEPKGLGMAGAILNAVAIVLILVWTLLMVGAAKTKGEEFNSAIQEFNPDELMEQMQDAVEEVQDMAEEAEESDDDDPMAP